MNVKTKKINKLPPIPNKIKKYLYKIVSISVANKKYLQGISVIEKYSKNYLLDENEKYRLALLYDHLAMEIAYSSKNKKAKNKILNLYLKKAQDIYKNIIKENPRYLWAYYGLGRVYSIKRDFDSAIYYQKKAYRLMFELPKNRRGALAIGSLYQQKGNFKNAEKWYLRENKMVAKNDFGTTLNLFNFYKQIKKYKKAFSYALKLEKLIKIEFRKKQYQGLKMEGSDFVKNIKEDIDYIKNFNK